MQAAAQILLDVLRTNGLTRTEEALREELGERGLGGAADSMHVAKLARALEQLLRAPPELPTTVVPRDVTPTSGLPRGLDAARPRVVRPPAPPPPPPPAIPPPLATAPPPHWLQRVADSYGGPGTTQVVVSPASASGRHMM